MAINQTLGEEQTCPTVAYQMSSVCVPVTVTPFARTGSTFTKCCGNATVTPGMAVCSGVKNGSCVFTISQNICVQVPRRIRCDRTGGRRLRQLQRSDRRRHLHRLLSGEHSPCS